MPPTTPSRRNFLQSSARLGLSSSLLGIGYQSAASGFPTQPSKPRHKVERLSVGAIGLRYQGSVDTHKASSYGDITAVCDVDKNIRDQAKASFGSTPASMENYQDLISRKDVDVVVIATPDHWHTKIAADAMRAGKDIYVEKPLTLTIQEGKLLRKVAAETGRVVQVGSWQRSDSRFRLAVEMVRQGRIGKLKKVEIVLGKNKTGGPFGLRRVPLGLNWDLWQGQTPDRPFLEQRCHYTFRWWYEYSGGQMTDWGAHHLDIAQWAINDLPTEIMATARFPETRNGFNVAVDYHADYQYPNGVTMSVSDTGRNGIMFIGENGRIFVNRGTISGKPVEQLATNPLDRTLFKVYSDDNLDRPERAGKLDAIVNHMGNFFDCVLTRKNPISDLESQHRSVSTCHLGNIAMTLGRKLQWDPLREKFINDTAADQLLSREQRKGYEVV
ncbi:MAG: Gfo/Idh/MocA family oxidoreductase [Pirellulaceae bacterium]|nr:Gfo/Idh/MocA family oxidoreductase [Pirellulaceae bacterium]